jgi:hypothetical protein
MADKIWTGAENSVFGNDDNWLDLSHPEDGDDVFITADYNVSISGSVGMLTLDLGSFTVEKGYTGTIGDKTSYLLIQSITGLDFKGSGACYIDINASAIDVRVDGTAAAATGKSGLYLLGSAIDEINVISGSVGIASRAGETATVTTLTINGGTVAVGDGCTLTNATVYSGGLVSQASITTLKNYNGIVTTEEAAAITTLSLFNGSHTHNGTGTIATANIEGGTLDLFRSGLARTITTLNLNPGGGVIYDPDLITITTLNLTGGPISINTDNA